MSAESETEVKFYVKRLAELPPRIIALGGSLHIPRTRELNLRFDTPAGDLSRARQVLRLRRDQSSRLTFKDHGEFLDGIRTRREVEVAVDNFDSAQHLLEALGYRTIFVYEKYRATYRLSGADIMLDELPFGDFVEIEGRSEALKTVAEQLGLRWDAAIPLSYQMLSENLVSRRSFPFRDLTFDNFARTRVQPADLGVKPADEQDSPPP